LNFAPTGKPPASVTGGGLVLLRRREALDAHTRLRANNANSIEEDVCATVDTGLLPEGGARRQLGTPNYHQPLPYRQAEESVGLN